MKILIVDDDPGQREKLTTILTPLGNCDHACDGEAAVALFEHALEDQTPYHVICMDIEMPRMNGHQALYAIRDLEKEWAVPGNRKAFAIMITARNTTEDILDSFHGACQGYVNKPVQADYLIHRIREYLPKRLEASWDNLPRRIPPNFIPSRHLQLEEPERLETQMNNLIKRFVNKWPGHKISASPILDAKKGISNAFTRTLDAAIHQAILANILNIDQEEPLTLAGMYEFISGGVILKLTLVTENARLLDGVRVPLRAIWTRNEVEGIKSQKQNPGG
ncbi:MAG: response regulator [Magnetococcus sp. YQC-5]